MSEINNGQKNEITKEVKIMFGQCGYNGKLHLEQVMQYCADLVTDLYTQNGQSRAFLNTHGYVQMVSRSSIHINRFPCENEKIIIHYSLNRGCKKHSNFKGELIKQK